LSDNDTSNSARESESEVDAEEIGDNYKNDLPQDAAQQTKRRTASPLFQWQGRILFHRFRILTMKIQVFRPI
jgi:hypothetical protein